MKSESALTSTLSNLAGAWARMVLGMVSGVVLARALGPELRGQYANLKLILTLCVPLLLFGYAGGVLYYGLRGGLDVRKFFWSGLILTCIVGAVLSPLLIPLIESGALGLVVANASRPAVLLTVVCVPLVMCNLYIEKSLLVYQQFKVVNQVTVIGVFVALCYYAPLAFWGKLSLAHGLIGILTGEIVKAAMMIAHSLREVGVQWRVSTTDILKPWTYGVRAMGTFLISKSSDKFDQIALAFFLSEAAYGVYSVAVSVSALVGQLPSSYLNVFFNQIALRDKDDAVDLYCRAQRITFLVTGGVTLCLAVFAYPLIYVMYGKAFIDGALVIIFYAPGVVFQVAARLSNKFYAARGRPLKNTIVYFCGFVVSVPFYFLLIPRAGLSGAAFSSSLGYFAAFVCSFLQLRQDYGISVRDIVGIRSEDRQFVIQRIESVSLVRRLLAWKDARRR